MEKMFVLKDGNFSLTGIVGSFSLSRLFYSSELIGRLDQFPEHSNFKYKLYTLPSCASSPAQSPVIHIRWHPQYGTLKSFNFR
jgi:hypothetical protein